MEKKNKLRAGRICVGATINSLAATSAFVVIALMLYELTGKLNVPYSTLSVAYTFAYAGMMLACSSAERSSPEMDGWVL